MGREVRQTGSGEGAAEDLPNWPRAAPVLPIQSDRMKQSIRAGIHPRCRKQGIVRPPKQLPAQIFRPFLDDQAHIVTHREEVGIEALAELGGVPLVVLVRH
jgi:hypothetical protein